MGEEGNEVSGMYNFTREDIDLNAICARMARMRDAELVEIRQDGDEHGAKQ